MTLQAAAPPGATDRPSPRGRRSGAARGQLFRPASRGQFWVWGAGTMLVLGLAWWGATAAHLTSTYFLPPPSEVWSSGRELAGGGLLWPDVVASARRITIGFLLSTVLALPIGLLMGSMGRVEAALEPLVDFIRYMPAVAFVPLTIVWFGVGEMQKYSIIFIGTFFQQVLMVMDNVKRTPLDFVRVADTLGLSRLRVLWRIVLPCSAPAIWDTLRITLGWAWTWLVVAELVAAQSGLGQRIMVSQRYFETDRIFFLIALIGLLGLVLDQMMKLAGRLLFPWAAGRER